MTAQPTRPLGRILLTGARGFLGSAVRARIKLDSVELVAADTDDGSSDDGIMPFDLMQPESILALFAHGPFDTVLHCAAVSGPMVLADRPADIWRINAQGTADLLEAARRSGVGRVVVCSSVEIYGARRRGVLDEDTPPDPPGVYGASKLAAEAAVLGYANGHRLDALAVRLGWIYGPGRRTPTTLDALLRAVGEGHDFEIAAHHADATHYLFVDDAVSGLLAAASSAAPASRVFNIVGWEKQTMGDVIAAVRRLCPDSRIALAAIEPSIEGPDGYSSRRAADEFGFRAIVSLDDGMARTIDAMRSRSILPDR